MRPDQFARLREILFTLQSLPAEKHQAYIEAECSDDPELLREAQSFVDMKVAAPGILEEGALTSMARSALDGQQLTHPHPMPESIGPYQVSGVLGRGGMGVVYRALQTEPLRREVAVKVMGARVSSEQIFQRFEAERQTLAVMEHPNIARVLDAGTTEEGEPYFVMELVRGISITEFCRRPGSEHERGEKSGPALDPRARLQLFQQACAGVQHAHQKGIIHRDLKPSNLMVTEMEGRPIVKIIDFGIARALEVAASDSTGADRPGASSADTVLPGPEVNLTQEGQILGTPEYMSPEQSAGELSLVDIRSDVYSLGIILYELLSGRRPYDVSHESVIERARVIKETTPPSLRTLSGTRHLDADLDTITQKALEKDPEDRYVSVAALEEDIERYLQGQPILAHPPSTMYQLGKLVRRHRIGFALALSMVVLLLAFAVTMTFMFEEQRRQRDRAEMEGLKAQRVSTFLQEMLESADPFEDGMDVTVREVLNQASDDLDRNLAEEPALRLEMHRTLGDTYRSLGDMDSARDHLDRAMAILEAEEGIETHAKARLLLDYALLLGATEPARSATMTREAMGLDARPGFQAEALLHLHTLAIIAGSYAQAESLALAGIALTREGYGDDHIQVVMSEEALGDVWWNLGRTDEVVDLYRRTSRVLGEQLGETHPRYLLSLNQLAAALENQGPEEKIEAEALKRQILAGWIEGLGPDSGGVAIAQNNLAMNLMQRSVKLADAERHMAEAVRIWRENLDPGHPYQIIGYNNLGYLRHIQLDELGAERAYREGLELRDAIDPDHPQFTMLLGNLALVLLLEGREQEAEELVREELRIREQSFGEEAGWRMRELAKVGLCAVLVEKGESAEALALGGPLVELLVDEDGDFFVSMLRNSVARAYAMEGQRAVANSLLAQSIPFLLDGYHSESEWIPERIYALQRSAALAESWGRREDSAAWRERAEELRQVALNSRVAGP